LDNQKISWWQDFRSWWQDFRSWWQDFRSWWQDFRSWWQDFRSWWQDFRSWWQDFTIKSPKSYQNGFPFSKKIFIIHMDDKGIKLYIL
jgi:hypothetical protein